MTGTWYLGIQPLNEPADVGPDERGRVIAAFDIIAQKRPSASFVSEVIDILANAGVGVPEVSLFGSSRAIIPEGPGPFLLVKPTSGAGPQGTHNDGPGAYRRPGVRILVHAATWPAAEAMAQAAYAALAGVRNQAVA